MPQIKQYTRQLTPNELINVSASAAAFGGDTTGLRAEASALSNVGDALGKLSSTVEEIKLKRDKSQYISMLSQFELENMRREEELAKTEFENDEDVSRAYVNDLQLRGDQFAESIPSSMRDQFTADYARMQQRFLQSGMQEQSRRVGVRAKLNLDQTVDNATNILSRDPSRYDEVASLITEQVDALPGLDLDKAATKDAYLDSLKLVQLNTIASNNPYEFKKRFESGEFDDVAKANAVYDKALNKIEQKQREAVAANKQKLNEQYKNFDRYYQSGVEFPNEEAKKIAENARALGNENMARDIEMKIQTKGLISEFVPMSLQEQSQKVETALLKAQTERTPEALYQYQELAKSYDNKIRQIQSGNALNYYAEIGVIDQVDLIDYSDAESIAASLSQRRMAQLSISELEGVRVPMITKNEMKEFASFYDSLPVGDKYNFLLNFSTNESISPEDVSDMAQLIASEEPQLATVLAVIKDAPMQAEKILSGAIRDVELPSTDIADILLPEYKTAISDDPEAFNQISRAVGNMAKELAFKEGTTVVKSDHIKTAAKSIMGEPITYKGESLLSFRKDDGDFVSSSEFKKITNEMTVEKLIDKLKDAPYINGKQIDNETLQESLKSFDFKTWGDGQYILTNQGDVLVNSNGQPFVFDYRILMQDVDTRGVGSRAWDWVSGLTKDAFSPLPGE